MARVEVPPITDQGRFIEWMENELAPEVVRKASVAHTFAAANTSERIRHGLGAVPQGYQVVEKDRACDVYRASGDTAADDRYIWLKCDTVDAAVTLWIF